MSEEEIISQDEMDDLSGKGMDSNASKREELFDGGQVVAYDFKQPEHTKQSHFPTLHLINEKTALELREKLEHMLQQKVEVAAQESHINKFGEFVHSLNIPIDIKKIHVPKLKGSFLICFDDELIDSVIEGYFGAPLAKVINENESEDLSDEESEQVESQNEDESDEQTDEVEDESQEIIEDIVEKEEFTNAESRISQKILNHILESMKSGWEILDDYTFEYEESESNPRLINYLDHEELIINMNFEIKIRDRISIIRVGLPYKMLDKVKHQLRRVVQNIKEASDKKWLSKMYEKLQVVPMELVGELGRVTLPVSKLIELKVGDTVRVPKPENITIYINETPILEGQVGESNGQTAIQVSDWIKPEVKK